MFSFPPDSFTFLPIPSSRSSPTSSFTPIFSSFSIISFLLAIVLSPLSSSLPLPVPSVPFFRTPGTLLPPFRSHRPVFPDVGHTHSYQTSRYSTPISSINGSISGSSAALKLISGSASMLAISSLAALSFSSRLSIATACR